VSIEEAKCFGVVKESKFYDPKPVPQWQDKDQNDAIVQTIHNRFGHASLNELKNLLRTRIPNSEGIQERDIERWHQNKGAFCSGCIEGKMMEHVRKRSTKPIKAEVPGEVTVGDIMFVELKDEAKKPLLVHMDVNTKLITGLMLSNKTQDECTKAILNIRNNYLSKGQVMKTLVFDREPAIVQAENTLNAAGIELMLKAAGQKVGLAEVTIRLIRNKARATKAGVRSKYGYLPANQFNADLCMDCIQVLNRIPKHGMEKSPFKMFTGKTLDIIRDFRVEWGEPIIVKKPKGIASDLAVAGQWGIVVQHIMNGTGVLKVYLVQSKKYAYRLQFRRAITPEWVIEALDNIDSQTTIGFEEITELYEREVLQQSDNDVVIDLTNIEEDEEVEIVGGHDKGNLILRSIDTIESAWNETSTKPPIKVENENNNENEEELKEENKNNEDKQEEHVMPGPTGTYVT
jgi:hypothetical protein